MGKQPPNGPIFRNGPYKKGVLEEKLDRPVRGWLKPFFILQIFELVTQTMQFFEGTGMDISDLNRRSWS
jgi:hypothetical protein